MRYVLCAQKNAPNCSNNYALNIKQKKSLSDELVLGYHQKPSKVVPSIRGIGSPLATIGCARGSNGIGGKTHASLDTNATSYA